MFERLYCYCGSRSLIHISLLLFLLSFSSNEIQAQEASASGLTVSTHDITVLVNKNQSFVVLARAPLEQEVSIGLVWQHEYLLSLYPQQFQLNSNVQNQTVTITGLRPGRSEVTAQTSPNDTSLASDLFVRITIANSEGLIYTSLVFGWIYFFAWSISFYPQIYINFKRKSVVGLNFDFVALNLVGFMLYSVFNSGLYWSTVMQDEYSNRYPRGHNPVLLNDVVFSLHATFATLISIIQCCIYERGDQRVSKTGAGLISVFALLLVISAGLSGGNIIHWLDFIYICSYIKLAITIIKYVPQALMNYRRKSTVGWSIGNILLDFTGGVLSMLQMMLNAYNYDDWASLFGDPTKFGLGMFSVLFDVFFMLQHYVFYRHTKETSLSNLTAESEVRIPTKDTPPLKNV